MGKRVLMQGNAACVEGALKAGMRFFAGYPITPSTEIAEMASLNLPKVGGHFIQMEDELASMAAIIGASSVGVKSMTATSGPGFSLKQENIGYACMTEIPCVVVNVQRSGPSTGLPTSPSQGDVMQARWGTHGDHPMIAISPSSVTEVYNLTIRAFNLAEKYKTPVILLMDEIVGHLREGIEISDDKVEVVEREKGTEINKKGYDIKDGELIPSKHLVGNVKYNITGLSHGLDGFPTNNHDISGKLHERLMKKIEENVDDIVEYEEYKLDDADTAIVCFGGTARSAASAIDLAREEGYKVGMFRVITVWPSPEKQLRELGEKVKRVIVVEHNYGQYLLEVQRIIRNNDCKIDFVGKVDGTVITPEEILKKIKEVK
ncbi:MAG: 2-oxoacid:acceptor oxidoreductase subunit alpha [Bacilli bacterium]|nr:2-oxoacid:acceptor oxidoreductase subunit alpha [Bacilli bacterium]